MKSTRCAKLPRCGVKVGLWGEQQLCSLAKGPYTPRHATTTEDDCFDRHHCDTVACGHGACRHPLMPWLPLRKPNVNRQR